MLNLSVDRTGAGRDNVSHSIDYHHMPSSRGHKNRPISKYSRQSRLSGRDNDSISKRSRLKVDRADANYLDKVSESFISRKKSNHSKSEVSSNRRVVNNGNNMGYLKSKIPSHLRGAFNRYQDPSYDVDRSVRHRNRRVLQSIDVPKGSLKPGLLGKLKSDRDRSGRRKQPRNSMESI